MSPNDKYELSIRIIALKLKLVDLIEHGEEKYLSVWAIVLCELLMNISDTSVSAKSMVLDIMNFTTQTIIDPE